jgi:photosystem II stability/assembly factor-like uncharacterized protein
MVQFLLVAIHPRDALTLYASISVLPWGTNFGKSELRSYDLPGVYVSNDGGDSWKQFSATLRNGSPLGISPFDPWLMFGHSEKGIVKSSDGGKTWRLPKQAAQLEERPRGESFLYGPTPGLKAYQIVADPSDKDIVYIVSNKGLYQSTDGGDNWCLLNLGFDVLDAIHSLGYTPGDSKQLFLGTVYGVFHSSDGGKAWKKIYPM